MIESGLHEAPKRAEMVLVIVTGFERYQMTLIRGMQAELSQRGLALFGYSNYIGNFNNESFDSGSSVPQALVCLLEHHRPTGVILTNALSDDQGRALREILTARDIPTVYLAQEVPDQVCVRADNEGGMRELMRHLLDECGVRTAAMIRGYSHHVDHVVRERVFREELARRNIPIHEELFADGRGEREVARNGMREILARRRDIEAVVTTDDWCANAAIETLTEAGIRVPNDVVVTGFDNYPIAQMSWPGITTIDQDLEGQGRLAVRALFDIIDGRPQSTRHIVPCRLVARGSTLNLHRVFLARTKVKEARDRHDDVVGSGHMAHLAQAHIADNNALRRTSRAMSECRSLAEVSDALASCLPTLGIQRCFLAIHDKDGPPTYDGIHRNMRLLVDYRDGQLHPLPDQTFSSCDLLPPYLTGELCKGFLGLQRLIVTSGELGYLLTDHPVGYVAAAESLNRDLGHSLEAIFSTEALKAHSEMLEELVRQRTAELEAEVVTRKHAEKELQRALVTDALTQIANRRAFQTYFEEQWQRHAAEGLELALLMIDVDMFKTYNDHYGHLKGDKALREVAACLRRAVRYPGDLASRFGGEEFTVLLAQTDREGALIVARRFREFLAKSAIPHEASSVSPYVTASVGIAVTVPNASTPPDILLAAADRALYLAKEQGRNRAVVGTIEDLRGIGTSWRCPRNQRGSVCP